MKLIKKNELESEIGKASFWNPKKLVGNCEYIAGIEEIDNILGSQNFFKIKPIVNFVKHSDGLEISLMNNLKLYYLGLKNIEIKSICLEKGNLIDIQNRSVIGRAIAGGLLIGPFGALIGGMTGMKDKVIKDNDKIVIITQFEETEQAFLFDIKKNKTKDVAKYFKENYPNLFIINN